MAGETEYVTGENGYMTGYNDYVMREDDHMSGEDEYTAREPEEKPIFTTAERVSQLHDIDKVPEHTTPHCFEKALTGDLYRMWQSSSTQLASPCKH